MGLHDTRSAASAGRAIAAAAACALLVAPSTAAQGATQEPAQGATPSPVQPYLDFVHGMAVRDAARALAAFAPEARVTAGPACTVAAPCIGHAAILERYLLPALARRDALPIYGQQFDGVWLRTRGEAVSVAGGRRIRGGHAFELRGGQIVSLSQQLDAPPTALTAARANRATTASPPPTLATDPIRLSHCHPEHRP